MNYTTPVLLLALAGLCSSCSSYQEKMPKLADLKKIRLSNPFDSKIPIREISDEQLAALLQEQTLASHNAEGLPDGSAHPIDFNAPEFTEGHDLLSASLLPPKSAGSIAVINADGTIPEHRPIIPKELLDEEDTETLTVEEAMDSAPLVPDAPLTVEISEPVASGE